MSRSAVIVGVLVLIYWLTAFWVRNSVALLGFEHPHHFLDLHILREPGDWVSHNFIFRSMEAVAGIHYIEAQGFWYNLYRGLQVMFSVIMGAGALILGQLIVQFFRRKNHEQFGFRN